MSTWHFHIEGQVQGVGFRPHVFRVATEEGLRGWVNNAGDGVHICFNADAAGAQHFRQRVLAEAPRLARITREHLEMWPSAQFEDFRIAHSREDGEAKLLLSPDFALCPDCRAELHGAGAARRQGYAFVSCTLCGPRYSIIQRLPYDRPHTSMAPFALCADCAAEYADPADRRHFAQTNTCGNCAIPLYWAENGGEAQALGETEWLARTLALWQRGGIVAIKGIGGYLLTCDAGQGAAVRRLRARKQRPSKPFALMFPDLGQVEAHCQVRPAERAALGGPEAPIVLLPLREGAGGDLALADIAPGLGRLGVMLPYAPIFEILLAAFGRPIVATSGNASGLPIAFEAAQARERLGHIADAFLDHARAIVLPQDDSVWQFGPLAGQRVLLRRGRGMAPTCLLPGLEWPAGQCDFAAGADLKSSLAYTAQGHIYLSQYLGALGSYEAQAQYAHTLAHFIQLFGRRPQRVFCDKHPHYHATQWAKDWAAREGLPLQPVQHHLAHFAAILGEHELLDAGEAVLGVIWDGTGWGDDGQVWGGEFFSYAEGRARRVGHLAHFPHLAGDKMAREPRLAALACSADWPEAQERLRPRFSAVEWGVYARLLAQNGLQSSSMGRLFDAVAALLGFMDQQSYEGEAALHLEEAARQHLRQHGWPDAALPVALRGGLLLWQPMLRELLALHDAGRGRGYCAAAFHLWLCGAVREMASAQGLRHLAFSGGVFQNALLADLLRQRLPADWTLYFHEQLPPNDEHIALGQLLCARIGQFDFSDTFNAKTHVLSDSRKNTVH